MAGLIASRMALNNKQAMGWIAAGVMLIFTIMVNVMIPGPMWMKIGDPLAVILLGIIGAKLGSRG